MRHHQLRLEVRSKLATVAASDRFPLIELCLFHCSISPLSPAMANVHVLVTPRMRAAYKRCVQELPSDQLKTAEFIQMASVFRATTPKAVAAAAAAAASEDASTAAAPVTTLTFAQVQQLSRLLRSTLPPAGEKEEKPDAAADGASEEEDASSYGSGFVHELLRGSSVSPLPIARSTRRQDPAFKRYLAEQRLKQDRREYAMLVADLPGNRSLLARADEEGSNLGSSYASATRDIGHGINILTLMVSSLAQSVVSSFAT